MRPVRIIAWVRDCDVDWQRIMESPLSVGLYALNAFNRKYIVGTDNQLNTFGIRSALYSAPLFYGIEVRYEFGQ